MPYSSRIVPWATVKRVISRGLVYDRSLAKERNPNLNTQTDSIRAHLFVSLFYTSDCRINRQPLCSVQYRTTGVRARDQHSEFLNTVTEEKVLSL